jgi:hypothetical protein
MGKTFTASEDIAKGDLVVIADGADMHRLCVGIINPKK